MEGPAGNVVSPLYLYYLEFSFPKSFIPVAARFFSPHILHP